MNNFIQLLTNFETNFTIVVALGNLWMNEIPCYMFQIRNYPFKIMDNSWSSEIHDSRNFEFLVDSICWIDLNLFVEWSFKHLLLCVSVTDLAWRHERLQQNTVLISFAIRQHACQWNFSRTATFCIFFSFSVFKQHFISMYISCDRSASHGVLSMI